MVDKQLSMFCHHSVFFSNKMNNVKTTRTTKLLLLSGENLVKCHDALIYN